MREKGQTNLAHSFVGCFPENKTFVSLKGEKTPKSLMAAKYTSVFVLYGQKYFLKIINSFQNLFCFFFCFTSVFVLLIVSLSGMCPLPSLQATVSYFPHLYDLISVMLSCYSYFKISNSLFLNISHLLDILHQFSFLSANPSLNLSKCPVFQIIIFFTTVLFYVIFDLFGIINFMKFLSSNCIYKYLS